LAGLLCALFACAHSERPARDPDGSQKRVALGQDYYSKHMVAPALIELSRALELDPENPDAYYMLGLVKMGQGVEHLELAERASCLHGAAAEAERADAAQKLREAAENFQLALKYRPGFAEALDGLAVVAIHGKDFESAVRYETQAQESAVFAENVLAKGNLGWAYYGKKDLLRAEKELREAVAKAPKFCVGHYRLAQVLFDRGEFAGAADELQLVADLKCPIQEAFRLLGLARERLHAPGSAKKAFETCVQLAPKSCLAEECRRYAGLIVNTESEK